MPKKVNLDNLIPESALEENPDLAGLKRELEHNPDALRGLQEEFVRSIHGPTQPEPSLRQTFLEWLGGR